MEPISRGEDKLSSLVVQRRGYGADGKTPRAAARGVAMNLEESIQRDFLG